MLSHPNDLLIRFKPVISKRLGVVLGLWGEAGIGKTYTVRRLLPQLQCQSFSLHATAALPTLVKALPKPRTLDLWTKRMLERLEQGESVPVLSAADVLGALLAKLAPVVLHLEDLHEAGPERLGFITRLAQIAQRSKGVGLLVTSRGELPQPIQSIRLEPLSAEAATALLSEQIASELPPEASDFIFAHAGGNPLFTLEYFRYLTRQGFLWNDARQWNWRSPPEGFLPVTVEALIEQIIREATNSPEALKALETRAMLPEVAEPVWAEVAGLTSEQLVQARFQLQHRGLLQESHFAHPLFGEVSLHLLSPTRRQELARRALQALRDDPRATAQFVGDAGLEAEEALGWLLRAAQAAKEAGDPVQAARFEARAAGYAKGNQQSELALEAAQGLRHSDTAEALRLGELALKLGPHQAEAISLLGELYATEHRADRLGEVLARLTPQQQSSPEWLGPIIRWRGTAGQFEQALQLWDQHPEFQALADAETTANVAQTMYNLGHKDQSEALALSTLERPLLSALERVELLSTLAIVAFARGDMPKAEALFSQIIALAPQTGQPRRLGIALLNRSTARLNLTRYPESAVDAREAAKLFAESGHRRLFAQVQLNLGIVYLEMGQYLQAEDTLLASLEVLEQTDTQGFLASCVRSLCDLYREWNPPHGPILALKHAQAGLRFARSKNSPRFLVNILPNAAVAEALNGNLGGALERLQEARPLIEQLGEPFYQMYLCFAEGFVFEQLGQIEPARQGFAQAQTFAQQFGSHLEAHKSGLELARLNRDRPSARQHLAWFEAHGLVHGANLVRRYFPQLEETAGGGKHEEKDRRGEEEKRRSRETQLTQMIGFSSSPFPPFPSSFLTATRPPILEVLGPMQFTHQGHSQPIRGHKRQELLALLLEARLGSQPEVSRLTLLETLYPAEGERRANAALKELVSSLRESLGQSAILTTSGGYALGTITTDAEAFLQTGDTALWRGVYLEGLDPSLSLGEPLYLALKLKTEETLPARPSEAARLARILLEGDPYNPQHLQLCLQALRALGNYKTLGRIYQEAREQMQEVGQPLPDKWTEFLA